MAGIASLKGKAAQVGAQGRGKDRHLLHVTTKELQGLHSLAARAGTKMTKNPKTGVYEAGWFESLLPVAAGAVGTFFGGPLGGAAAGAAAGAAFGDKQNSTLMNMGLGAIGGWGGGSLVNSFTQAGLTAAESSQLAGAIQADGAITRVASTPVPMQAIAENPLLPKPYDFLGTQGAPDVSGAFNFPSSPENVAAYNKAVQFTPPIQPGIEHLSKGFQTSMQDPLKWAGDNKLGLGAAFLPLLVGGTQEQPYAGPSTAGGYSGQPQQFSYTQPRSIAPGVYENAYFQRRAAGGLAGLSSGGAATQPRMIKGPGTGLSDSVPAQVSGGPPAALADGEFVVSSDVVSALGGGSTDAGARKLYAMMDRVRQQAHGTKKQVKKVNDRKVLPV